VPASSTPEPSTSISAEVRGFVETMGSLMFETGIPRMPARVFSALLASSAGRMTSAELSAVLDASPAAISGAVRYLIQVGLVARERETGSRRDHFVLHNDVFYELMSQDARALEKWETGIRKGMAAVGHDTPAGRRMQEMVDFFAFLQEEIPAMMDRWKVRRAQLHG
jgi:DNA-binding transcriptional regulator GbsR (MarR family)